MKTRPIPFSGPMVRALLEDRKTQTRRILDLPSGCVWYEGLGGEAKGWFCDDPGAGWWHVDELACPYGEAGDRLWVREDYALADLGDVTPSAREQRGCRVTCRYTADGTVRPVSLTAADVAKLAARESDRHKPQPGRFMFRSCSRILLEVTSSRAEFLTEISAADLKAEGFPINEHAPSVLADFASQWDALNGPEAFQSNPWVWVIGFKVLSTG